MPYESRTDLITRLAKVDTALDAARSAVRYGVGERNLQRDIRALQDERKEIIEKIEAIDRHSDGFANKVKFQRPV